MQTWAAFQRLPLRSCSGLWFSGALGAVEGTGCPGKRASAGHRVVGDRLQLMASMIPTMTDRIGPVSIWKIWRAEVPSSQMST